MHRDTPAPLPSRLASAIIAAISVGGASGAEADPPPPATASALQSPAQGATQRWVDALIAIDAQAGDWREAFNLGTQVAELDPPDAALEVLRVAWPRLNNSESKQQFVKSWHFDLPYPLRVRAHPRTPEFFLLVLDDNDPEVSPWVQNYLATYAWRELEDAGDARRFLEANADKDARTLLADSMSRWAGDWKNAADDDERRRLADDFRAARHPFRRNPDLAVIAETTGAAAAIDRIARDPAMPALARTTAFYALKDIRPDSRTDDEWAALEADIDRDDEAEQAARLAEFEARERVERDRARAALLDASRTVGDDHRKRYLVHPPRDADAPADGHALLLVLPGGDGSIDFAPFVSGAIRDAAGPDTVVVQLVAPPLSDTPEDDIVWPRRLLPDPRVEFAIEPVAIAAIDAVRSEYRIDPARVYALGWSSGGPPVYALALEKGSPVRGAVVVMSVFRPDSLPPLEGAAGKRVAIIHSPTDFIDMRFPEAARDRLAAHGARTRLTTYEGGHGWHGASLERLAEAIRWIDADD